MNNFKYTALVIAFIVFIILSGCAAEKSECEMNSDCTQKNCFQTKCVDEKCVQSPIDGCCGNKQCEIGENSCNCLKDCMENKCEGKKLLREYRKTKYYTEYLEYGCNEKSECILDFDTSSQREIPLLLEKDFGDFKTSVVATINKPFDITNDAIDVEIELSDKSNTVIGPIKLEKIQFLKKSYLYANMDLDKLLNSVGDTIKVSVPLTYEPENVEEELSIEMKIDFAYTYRVSEKTGETRSKKPSYSTTLAEKIFIVVPGEKQ